jgi:hypothetical protein
VVLSYVQGQFLLFPIHLVLKLHWILSSNHFLPIGYAANMFSAVLYGGFQLSILKKSVCSNQSV